MTQWAALPEEAAVFDFSGEVLRRQWGALHAGDRVPWPDESQVTAVLDLLPAASHPSGKADQIAAKMQQAWRAFHAGDFAAAAAGAKALGVLAHAAANKAACIYADHLEEDEAAQQEIYRQAAENATAALAALPDDPNAHYFHALALGRYSQSISIAKALAQGLAGKVAASLKRALEVAPDHADAHLAFGLYHAEIINKVGKLVGGMTYGASEKEALTHLERALELNGAAPIVHIEYGNALYLLHGERGIDDLNRAYRQAVTQAPRDAMEWLDQRYARAELEE